MSLDYTEPDITPELALRRKTEEYFIRGEIVAICNAVIGEYVAVLAAACELSRLGFERLCPKSLLLLFEVPCSGGARCL